MKTLVMQKKMGGRATAAGEVGHQPPLRAVSEGGGGKMEMEQELEDFVETWAPVFLSPFLVSSPAWFTFSSDHFSHLQSGESKPRPPLP